MKTLSLRSLLPELHSRTPQNRWNGSERTVLRPNTRAITVTFAGGQPDETEEKVRIGEDTTRRLSLALGCLYLLSSDLISIRILKTCFCIHPEPHKGEKYRRMCVIKAVRRWLFPFNCLLHLKSPRNNKRLSSGHLQTDLTGLELGVRYQHLAKCCYQGPCWQF